MSGQGKPITTSAMFDQHGSVTVSRIDNGVLLKYGHSGPTYFYPTLKDAVTALGVDWNNRHLLPEYKNANHSLPAASH